MKVNKADFQRRLGRRIAELRIAKGMSQSDLGRACDKDRQSINKIEQGDFNATAYYLYEIAGGLNVSLTELFEYKLEK